MTSEFNGQTTKTWPQYAAALAATGGALAAGMILIISHYEFYAIKV